jgi:tetratricopeptide (TPR) repeat protein
MSTFTERTVRGDDARLGAVYANYESNLRDIAAVAAHAGARMVLATVVANLRDCPPFASLHRAGISPSQLERWKAAYGDGVGAWETDRPAEAIRSVGEALKVDPEYAEAHFVLARLLEATGDEKGARAQYLEALHWDALRFRPEPEINGIARRVASESNGAVLLADSALEMGFGSTGPAPLPGREMLLEHVHFSWEGNVRMGRLIAGACASALFGAAVPPGHWLDSAGCADAVGYTPFGRLRMLQQMEPIREKPPFTNQITFGEDQVRYRHEVDVAESAATSAGGLEAAREQLESALGRSPQEANLALRLSEVEAQAGDSTGALRWLDRVLELEPRSPELLVQRARALEALRRAQEAQDSILEAIRMDAYNLPSYPALVDVYKETGDFELARSVLLGALSRNPSSGYIRLSYADLLFFHGEREKAEAECRAVLAIDPADPDPLGRLVSLYNAQGHSDRAFLLMQEARSTQPLNYENNLGLAKLYEAQGDEERAVDCLRAAERSGPAAPEAHIFIARHLAKMKQHREELVELHRARRVALLLGEEDLAHRISETIREATGNPAPGAPDNRH